MSKIDEVYEHNIKLTRNDEGVFVMEETVRMSADVAKRLVTI